MTLGLLVTCNIGSPLPACHSVIPNRARDRLPAAAGRPATTPTSHSERSPKGGEKNRLPARRGPISRSLAPLINTSRQGRTNLPNRRPILQAGSADLFLKSAAFFDDFEPQSYKTTLRYLLGAPRSDRARFPAHAAATCRVLSGVISWPTTRQ